MKRSEKTQAVANLKEALNSSNTVVVVHYRGLTVEETSELRKTALKNGANVKVTKNTLARLAANDTKFDKLSDMLKGPTAITYSDDEVAAAKVAVDFSKDNEKLIIIGGVTGGRLLSEDEVKQLASTPSLDESRAKIIGLLNAPATKIARLLKEPGGQIARVISARSSQGA